MLVSLPRRPVAAFFLATLVVLAAPTGVADPARSVGAPPELSPGAWKAPAGPNLDESFGRLPLQFEVNRGQVDPQVRYLTRGRGSTLFLTDDEAVWVLSRQEKAPERATKRPLDRRNRDRDRGRRISSVLRMHLEGSKPNPVVDGLDRLPGNVNYFIGNDPKKWRSDIPTYRKVKVGEVYEGVDLVYYGNQRQLEYDFVVKPGVDPSVIRIAFTGADRISTDAAGDLVVATRAGDLRMRSPLVYQERDGQRQLVAAAYVVRPGEKGVEFRLAEYDRARELVIDPVIVWATFLGGSPIANDGDFDAGTDSADGVAVGGDGHPIVVGWTNCDDFPTTPAAYQPVTGSPSNGVSFVTKLNQTGTHLVYSTYLSAYSFSNFASAVAADPAGNAYVTGVTDGRYFPSTPGTYFSDGNIYIVKLNASGSQLIYAARLGSTDSVQESPSGIAVDPTGAAYIAGEVWTGPFPTTPGAFQDSSFVNGRGSFVAKLSPNGQTLVYSTVLTGMPGPANTNTVATDIAVDSAGFAYVTGWTAATSFPVTAGAFQSTLNGLTDAFVAKLSQGGSHLVYSTLLGGSEDDGGHALALDQFGHAFVVGTPSRSSFPTTPGTFSPTCDLNCGGFVTKVAPDGRTLVYSTYFPDHGATNIVDVLVDSAGRAVIAGQPYQPIPLSPGSPSWEPGGSFVSRLTPDGSAFDFGWFLGGPDLPSIVNPHDTATGIAAGPAGDVFVAGSTGTSIPTTPGVFQPSFAGGMSDSFVARIDLPMAVSATAVSPSSGPSLGGTSVTITGAGFQAGALVLVGGIPATVSTMTPTSINAVTGPHADGLVDVVVRNPDDGIALIRNGFTYVCGGTPPTAALSGDGTVCAGQSATLSVALAGSGPWSLVWSDGVTQSGIASSPATRAVTPLVTTTYTVLAVADTICAGSATGSAVVAVNPTPSATLTAPSRVCAGVTNSASVPPTAGASYVWTVTNGTIVSGQGTSSLLFVGTSDPVTVAVQAALGACSASDSRAIPVAVAPSGSVSGGGTICAGGSTGISFNLTGTAPFSITWSDGFVQSVSAAGPGSRTVSPTATRSYTITSLLDATGCPAGPGSGSATVAVNPLPSAAISAPAAYCTGASGLVASVPDAGPGATYAWTISGGSFSGPTNGRTVSFTPAGASATLGATVTLPTTCSASSSRILTLSPPPSAIVSGGGTVCAGSDNPVNVVLSGTPPFSFTWSDGLVQSGIASTTVQRIVQPQSPVTYSVTAVRDAACTGSASGSATFSVVAPPSAVVMPPTTTICPGGSATIGVQLGGPGPYTLVWADGLVENVSGSESSRTVSPAATTVYGIATVSNGTCSVPGNGSTTVVVFPDASAVAIAGPQEACEEVDGLVAAIPDSGEGTTYTWTVANGTIVSGQGTRSVVWTAGKAGEAVLGVSVRVPAGCQIAGTARVRLNARPARPALSAPAAVESGARGVVAEVVGGAGPGWDWTVTNATVTSGAGTSRITFDVGDPGVVLVDVVERNAKGCGSPAAHAEVLVKGLSYTRLAPIVLDVASPGGSRYTTELALSNPSPSPVRVDVVYTAASSLAATGSGRTTETLGAGRQTIIPDVLAWLRGKGLAIPADGSSQGGTLTVTFDGLAAGWRPSATTRTTVPSGGGRAGLSMPAVDPTDATSSKVWLFGLREDATDRSNVALVHAGADGPLDLRVTLCSGAGVSVPRHVLPTVRLEPGQWLQLNSVLRAAGFASGYALVERVGGTAPFHAYAVFNDNATNDGSVVAAVSTARLTSASVVPVVVETGSFASELVLANPGPSATRAGLWFTESLANPGGYSMGGVTIDLAPGEQKVLPGILAELRRRGLEILPANRDYAGTLVVTFSVGGEAAEGWAGARTATTGSGAGHYGLFGPAQTPKASATEAWIFGLLQNAEARTNLALVNAASNLGPVTLRYTVFDGATGKKATTSEPITLGPGAWTQLNGFLSKWSIANGYVRVERVAGTAPFVAYAVVNDGGVPGKGTGDGSFVEMSTTAP